MAQLYAADPALSALERDVELERLRLRARFMGLTTDPRAPLAEKERTREWVLAGARVPDERAYLRWLEARS